MGGVVTAEHGKKCLAKHDQDNDFVVPENILRLPTLPQYAPKAETVAQGTRDVVGEKLEG
ncbi:hypothetical protein COY07_05720 [Candidatus Peregrinibacteria bacterium CG_4_10_14_0_2_um_filter_43_11]|nr:MAG: hypothetical protein COY07_05720 [Candidatus Peregrinibacteria bacterium CG_4_10_14_0_2_um_filter_43_11]